MMKRTLAILIVCALALLAGCGKKADPMDVPPLDEMASVDITRVDGATVSIDDPAAIEAVGSALDAAEPTSLQSVNDALQVDAYGTISINTAGEPTVLYYCEEGGRRYVEQPYRGIYRLQGSFEEALQD